MKLKQSVNLLMIALFVWAFQSTTIHTQQHALEEIAECHVCHASEHLDLSHHNTTVIVVPENIAVKIRRDVEKIVLSSAFDNTDVLPQKQSDIIENRRYCVEAIVLGFKATAPPANII